MSKLPCEVVRDLFPSYIDELTSEVTKELVEEHMSECEGCKKVLSLMKNPEAEPVDFMKEKEEIDFLKKARKKNQKHIMFAVIAVAAVLFLLLVVKNWFIGTYIPGEYVACQVQVKGNVLSVNGALLDSRYSISEVEFTEEDDVVTISFQSVRRSPFSEASVEQTYIADRPISEVHLGNRILWADGQPISAITSAVYQTAHPYIGDMSANQKTANALNMSVLLGSYTNKLQTTTEPYAWKFVLDWKVDDNSYDGVLEKVPAMDGYAYVLLALIENLDRVTYEFMWGDYPALRSITIEDASEFAGEDIKAVGKSIAKLQHLMEKAELIDTAYVMDDVQWLSEEKISIELANLTEDELSMISLYCYMDGELYSNQVVSNADGSNLENGEVFGFEFLPEDLEGEWDGSSNLVFRIGIRDKDGRYRECVEHVNLPVQFGYTYSYMLTGNMEDGYHISQ